MVIPLIIVGSTIHFLLSGLIILSLNKDYIKEDKIHLIWIFLFPIVNLIIAFRLMEIKKNSLERSNEWKKTKVEDLEDQILRLDAHWKSKYQELERKKFRKVRVGDVFRVPNTDGWKKETRNKKCTIVEITNEGVEHTVEGRPSTEIWNTRWEFLKEMVFLNEEPFKPFEFIEYETSRTS